MTNLDDKYFDDLAKVDDSVLEDIAKNTLEVLRTNRNNLRQNQRQGSKQSNTMSVIKITQQIRRL